jgi:Histidine kinase-, DNA gyrase B-, and HSP90-like ATPase
VAAVNSDRTATERQRRYRAKLKNRAELALVRQDWALFLQPDRLAQKAGCAQRHLRRMAVKELVDNAADASSEVRVEQLDTVRVVDQGSGLDRGRVLELFAIDRPMTSSKLWRRPTRGAVGNGLRVVTGAVLGSGGVLTVESRGRRFQVEVDRLTGETQIAAESASKVMQGTAITVCFGTGLPTDPDILAWARVAAALAGPAARPLRSHPCWYTEEAWRELVEAAAHHTAADLLASGFGIDVEEDCRPAGLLTLLEAQHLAAAVPEPKLLPIPMTAFDGAHAQVQTRLDGMPVLVQAWATARRVSRGRTAASRSR